MREHEAQLSPADRLELVDTICDEAARLDRLVVNLLDMTRLEAGPLVVRREWVPVDEVVGSALARVEARTGARRISVEVPAELPLISVDAVLLEHALVNLLDNALKHTPPGAPIDVTARTRDGAVVLEVADRGPGLPPDPERLFEKFVRDAAAGVEGAGLGLAIARGIARAHGGDVSAAPRDGGGARFSLVVPSLGAPPA